MSLAADKGYIERFENASGPPEHGCQDYRPGMAVLSKTGDELTTFRESVFKEFSEEEVATMHRLMRKLQRAVQINYAKYKKK